MEELESRGVLLSEEKKMYEEKLLAESQARQEEHSRYLVRLISFNKIFKFPEGKKKEIKKVAVIMHIISCEEFLKFSKNSSFTVKNFMKNLQ